MANKEDIKKAIKESGLTEVKGKFENQGQKTKGKGGKIFAIFAAAITMVGAAATLTGCFNTQTTSQQLATTTISYNAQTSIVSWTEVPNANGYKIVISSAKLGVNEEVNTNKDTKSVELKTYLTASTDDCLISITAKGDGKSYTDSEVAQKTVTYTQAQTQEATKLQMGAIRFDQTTKTFSWDRVEGAKDYVVKVNGAETTQTTTEVKLNKEATGKYTISVVARTSDATKYTNSDAATKEVTISQEKTDLGKVAGIQYNANNQTITWNAVENATKYEVTFNNGTTQEIAGTTYTIQTTGLETGAYDFSIKAVDATGTYNNSETTTQKIQFVSQEKDTLAAATNIQVNSETKTISWDKVENATSYEITFAGQTVNVTTPVVNGNKVSCTVTTNTNNLKTGANDFTITAKGGTEYIDSVATGSVEVKQATLGNVTYSNGTFSWQGENVSKYSVKLDNGTAVEQTTTTYAPTLTTGEHTLEVTAFGSGFTKDAVASKQGQMTKTQQLNAVTNLEVSNSATKTISWNAVDNATGYKVTYAGTEYAVQAGTTFTVPNTVTLAETDSISVLAVGNEIYTTSEATTKTGFVTKVATPANLAFEDNTFTWDASTGATGYVVSVNGVAQAVQTERAYAITEGTANVSVVAVGNGGFVLNSTSTAQVQGTYEEAQQQATYADVETALIAKLQTATQAAYPRGVVSNIDILGINTNTGLIYYNYNLGTGSLTARVQIDGLANVTSYDNALTAVNGVTLASTDVQGKVIIQSTSNAENLVAMSIANGEFAQSGTTLPSGCTAQNLKFATATTFDNNKDTNIVAVFDNGTVLEYKLRVVATSSATAYQEYMNGAAGTASNITTENNYTELDGAFTNVNLNQQGVSAPRKIYDEEMGN